MKIRSLKNKKKYGVIVCLLILFTGITVFGGPCTYAQGTQKDETILRLSDRIPELLEKYKVPGASVTYISEGNIVFSKGYGVRNIITKTAVEDETIFEAGSNGKVLAAYICLMLAREGKIDIDAPVANYVKNTWIYDGTSSNKITARQLLSHTSGLSNSIEIITDKKVHFEPGTKYKYSGVGFTYLQKIIESITGKSFNDVAKEYVFTPLKMSSSSFAVSGDMRQKAASPHMDIKTLFTYLLGPYLILFILLYLVGFISGVFTKFKYYSKFSLFKVCLLPAFCIEIILVLFILSKILLPLMILAVMGIVLYLAANFLIKKYYISYVVTILVLITGAFILQVDVPVGNDLIAAVNPAYS